MNHRPGGKIIPKTQSCTFEDVQKVFSNLQLHMTHFARRFSDDLCFNFEDGC